MTRDEYTAKFDTIADEDRKQLVTDHWEACCQSKRWGDLCSLRFYDNHIGTGSINNAVQVADRRSGHASVDRVSTIIPTGSLENMMLYCRNHVIPWFLQQGYRSGNFILEVSLTMSTSVVSAKKGGVEPKGDRGKPVIGIDGYGLVDHYEGTRESVHPTKDAAYALFEAIKNTKPTNWRNLNKTAES